MAKALRYVGYSLLGLLVVPFAFIGFLHSVRGTPVKRVSAYRGNGEPPATGDSNFFHAIQLLTGTPLNPGHSVDVAINGDQTYPRLWEDLRSARESITMQMYYCKPGEMADTLKEILLERAAAGVRVLFLHDAFGSQLLTGDYLDSLRTGGVHVAMFRPVRWYQFHKVQHRSHIRVVVVDATIGWTGGFGIDDKWFGDGRSPEQWRETNVRFTGPAVEQLQAIFAAGWAEATGNLLAGPPFFRRETSPRPFGSTSNGGGITAGIMHAAPTIGSTSAERLLASTIASARRTLYISNAYFVPDSDFRQLLKEAAQRGVDVRVLTADENSDVKTTWWAGRHFYEELLEAGIRIYEYKPTMMHAKTLVADGIWSSVGTLNFDNRSMVFNDESNLNVWDAEFAARMNTIFFEDLEYAEEVTLETMRARPWKHRVMEWKAARLQRLL